MSQRTKIKICGIRTQPALIAAVNGGADFIGFVHWSGSPRYIEPDAASALAQELPDSVEAVGLYVDASVQTIAESRYHWVQLHGSEDEAACEQVKAAGKEVIRGFRFDEEDIARWDACEAVDVLLVDGSAVGGEGLGFEHGQLKDLLPMLSKPLILAGGLDPENVQDAIESTRPWAVDVSSGVERVRGEKDPLLIEAFCRAAKAAR